MMTKQSAMYFKSLLKFPLTTDESSTPADSRRVNSSLTRCCMDENMIKETISTLYMLGISGQVAFADWHHGGSHGASQPSPNAEFFVVTAMIIVLSGLALLFTMGPVLVMRARKIREMLWMIPIANIILYILSISLRPYPGGFHARFAPPGLEYTILEALLLLLLSICMVLIVAAIQWAQRKYRAIKTAIKGDTEKS